MYLILLVLSLLLANSLAALPLTPVPQKPEKNEVLETTKLLTRTSVRRESRRFGYGGSVTIIGAPRGSITIEGWPKAEIEVSAEIEIQADSEEELDQLARVNGFLFSEDSNHVHILTTGTHDRMYMKRVAPKFPKQLLGMPWKIDYRIRVPVATDVELNAGRGPLKVAGIEGALRISATETDAALTLTGGVVNATVGSGTLAVSIPVRSWRGLGADIRIASGDLTIKLPAGFNGDIDASVLRRGHIEESFGELQQQERSTLTNRNINGRAGSGGASFKFTVGDGKLYIKRLVSISSEGR